MSFSKLPGTVANVNQFSVYDWTDINNVKTEDTSFAIGQTHESSGVVVPF